MKNPVHPGSILKHDCLEPLNLTVTGAADWLGVGRPALSNVLNGKAGISPEMALRLEAAGWGTALGWTSMQGNYDLAQAKLQAGERIKVKRFPMPQVA